MYGSQAIGGIVNIILKSGRSVSGGTLDARGGSAGLFQGHAEYAAELGASGEAAVYFGGDWGRKGDYRAGKGGGTEVNTAWTRRGGMADLDWRTAGAGTLRLTLRSDGIYDTGFRGSAANHFAKESRSNHSADLVWSLEPPGSAFGLSVHNYMVLDVDDFRWASPRTSAQTRLDFNKRRLTILGTKVQPVIRTAPNNDLRLGADFEFSRLRTERLVIHNSGAVLLNPPQDMNQTEKVLALYAEDTLRLAGDRFTLRAGVRHTLGWLSLDDTPNVQLERQSLKYSHTTWSVGVNVAATESLSLRAGAASGFRSPVASELAGWTRFLNNSTLTYGNPDLRPETNVMYEAGLFAHSDGWFADLAIFHNEISDRIVSERIPSSPDSRYLNREGKVILTGVEFGGRVNVDEIADTGGLRLALGLFATYNFKMEDEDRANKVVPQNNSGKVDRVFQYQGSLFAQVGQDGSVPWKARITGILRGPVWYATEESLIAPAFEPNSNWIHRKSPYWIFNVYGEASVTDSVTVYGGVNNVFNRNYHPLFIAVDDGTTYLSSSTGGRGTSSPGAEFYAGVKYSF
jgi:vitamin B12 transporter